MELMPHIKALLDDLIRMTSQIDVKRTDIADRYETNTKTIHLYQQCAEILDGTPTFYTYTVYPKEVLGSYGKWVETSDKGIFAPLKPLTNLSDDIILKMSNGNKMTISKSDPINKANVGEGWIKIIDTDKFYPVKTYNSITKNFNYVVYPIDENGNIDKDNQLQNFTINDTIYSIKNLQLYIKDVVMDKYVPIRISFTSEYVSITEPIDHTFIYDSNQDGSYVEYVDNYKNENEKIVYDNTIIDNDTIDKYYHRYKIEYIYANSNYYSNSEEYISNKSEDETIYERIDNLEYCEIDDNMYLPIYVKNEYGTYIYDEENENFVDLSNDLDTLINTDPNLLYSKEITDIDESTIIYYRYRKLNSHIITQSLVEYNGESYLKYEEDLNKNFVIYYGYTTDIIDGKADIQIKTTESNNQFKTYFYETGSELVEYVLPEDSSIYYLYEDQFGNCVKKYTDNTHYYEYITDGSDTRYSLSESIPNAEYEECVYKDMSSLNKYYVFEGILTSAQIDLYYRNRNSIPEEYREDLKVLMQEYIMKLYCPGYNDPSGDFKIPQYTGETNRYYRELNGLPPLNTGLSHPRIDRRKVNPYYEGKNTMPYLYELTDAEVEVLEETGYLKQYQESYPDLTYLKHLGKHRVDVITARQAAPYDILHINDSEMTLTKEMFLENYPIAKNYFFKRYYKPNMFGVHEYYHAYVGYMICILALVMCMTKSGDILIENKFVDQETVDLILKSYGFDHTFDSIPLVYRREIARNILKLIKNKGIDNIYKVIYDLFNIDDVEVYKYYFKKVNETDDNGNLLYYMMTTDNEKPEKVIDNSTGEILKVSKLEYEQNDYYKENYTLHPLYELSIAQSPVSSNNIIKDILDASNSLNFDDITSGDNYWGVYESDESVKNKIMDLQFNYMNSKYITINNRFSLTELNFNTAYLLNYFLEATTFNEYEVNVDMDELENPQSIANLIIMLFAIQSIKYKFDGNIPNDIVSAATVYKFNLDESVAGEDGEASNIIDYYLNYMTQNSAIKALEIKDQINQIARTNNNTSSLKSAIYNDKSDKNVTELAETYSMNIEEDDPITSNIETSLYNKLLEYRENARTLKDFRCFDELLKCISVCEETQKAYKLTNAVWEKMYECSYNDEASAIEDSDKMYYTDILHSWTLLSTDEKNKILKIADSNPKEMYRLSDGNYIYTDDENYQVRDGIVYEKDIDGSFVEINTLYDTNIYYEHFTNISDIDGRKGIVSTKNAIFYDFDIGDYVININDISKLELITTSDVLDLSDKIDVYEKENMLDKLKLIDKLNVMIQNDINNLETNLKIENVNIGNNNYAYIGNTKLDEFIENTSATLSGPCFYVEISKDSSTIENKYNVVVYRKCDHALTYAMYLREMAPELYEILSYKSNENEKEYEERLDRFNSTIIASIENSINNEELRNKLNLSYVDFSNIAKYIKLVINVFKSYSIDLSSMDIIYNIDDKNNNRIKIIEDYSTNEKYGINSNIHMDTYISYDEKSHYHDIMKIKDEVHIETYGRQIYNEETE